MNRFLWTAKIPPSFLCVVNVCGATAYRIRSRRGAGKELKDLLSKISPAFAAVMSGEHIAAEFAVLTAGTLAVLYIGCRLFQRKEF